MIEFLMNNIIWVVLIVIIVIMAIVGYFAENSELGKKIMKPAKKESKPKQTSKPAKPQTFEDAIEQIDKNATLAATINGDIPAQENIMNEGIVESPVIEDAWSKNIDTNEEQPQEVVEANPDEWLNAPIDLTVESEETEKTEEADYLYDLPEVSIDELPGSDEFDNIEVLDVSDDFEDIEVLNVVENAHNIQNENLEENNPVEDELGQFSNSNDFVAEEQTEEAINEQAPQVIEANEMSENTSESDDIWK